MKDSSISLQDQLKDMKEDLKSGKPIQFKKTVVYLDNQMDKEEFGLARKRIHLTQKQLAKLFDLSIKTIQAYEQGKNVIPGLIAKNLRLMNSDNNFFSKMIGKITPLAKQCPDENTQLTIKRLKEKLKSIEKDFDYLSRKMAA
jgi:transcriptional regulator with XRE-family HTH domain